MDVNKLAIFLDTVSMGSMKRAAEKYNYTQGGIFYLVNSIEQELGLHLITRDHKGITWNQAGRELEPYFRNLVETEREISDKITKLIERTSRNLTIGAYPSIVSLVLPQVIYRFMGSRQDVNVILRMGSGELLEWLESGQIDLAVMRMEPGRENDFIWRPLMDLQTYAAIPSAFLERPYKTITLEEFIKFPFLYSTSNPINERINAMAKDKQPSRIRISTPDGLGTLRMVSQGLGATSIIGLYKDICPKNVEMIPFAPPIVHSYYVVTKADDSVKNVAEDFARELREYCRGYAMSVDG